MKKFFLFASILGLMAFTPSLGTAAPDAANSPTPEVSNAWGVRIGGGRHGFRFGYHYGYGYRPYYHGYYRGYYGRPYYRGYYRYPYYRRYYYPRYGWRY